MHGSRHDSLPLVRGARERRAARATHADALYVAGALTHKRRAVRVALAPLMADAAASSTQVSQLLGGHAVDVVDHHGSWLRVVGADRYSGWVHAGYLGGRARGGNGTPPSGWHSPRPLSLGCVARTPEGVSLRLPLGAHVPHRATLESGEALGLTDRRSRFRASADSVLACADRFFHGTPYVWGGVTPWGADCSGFVQSVFALHGIMLPRDAWQQADAGELIPSRDDVRAGDLIFFCAEGAPRMTHVAIATSPRSILHLSVSRGGFATDDLGGGDQVSRALNGCYRFARRVLPS